MRILENLRLKEEPVTKIKDKPLEKINKHLASALWIGRLTHLFEFIKPSKQCL